MDRIKPLRGQIWRSNIDSNWTRTITSTTDTHVFFYDTHGHGGSTHCSNIDEWYEFTDKATLIASKGYPRVDSIWSNRNTSYEIVAIDLLNGEVQYRLNDSGRSTKIPIDSWNNLVRNLYLTEKGKPVCISEDLSDDRPKIRKLLETRVELHKQIEGIDDQLCIPYLGSFDIDSSDDIVFRDEEGDIMMRLDQIEKFVKAAQFLLER